MDYDCYCFFISKIEDVYLIKRFLEVPRFLKKYLSFKRYNLITT